MSSTSLPVLGLLLLTSSLVAACSSAPDPAAVGKTTAEAYTGAIPTMEQIDKPAGVPDSWAQPDSEGVFNQYGYCGATAAANLLRWYKREVSPKQAIDDGCWSEIGTLPSSMSSYFEKHNEDLKCAAYTLPKGDALGYLEQSLFDGKPVVLQFMTGSLNAHWVTVFGLKGHGADTKVQVESWGGYFEIKWADLEPAWRSAWGGPFPHIICDEASPLAEHLDTRDLTGAGDYSGDTGSGAGGGGDYGGNF